MRTKSNVVCSEFSYHRVLSRNENKLANMCWSAAIEARTLSLRQNKLYYLFHMKYDIRFDSTVPKYLEIPNYSTRSKKNDALYTMPYKPYHTKSELNHKVY